MTSETKTVNAERKKIDKISVVVFTRNEENNIRRIIGDISEKVKGDHEILIVDDSTDRTPAIVNELSAGHGNLKLVPQLKKGFTNAYITGVESSSGGAVVMLVGDLSDRVEDINLMRAKLNEGYDVVCASRYMPGGKKNGGSALQSFLSVFVGKSLWMITGIPTSDISNSFKMYRKEMFDRIIIEESSCSVSMQVILKAFFAGFKITEIPTVWEDRVSGKSKFSFLKQAKH